MVEIDYHPHKLYRNFVSKR